MSIINIAGAVAVVDESYRYKMPKIIGKVEGRGNGIKTVLFNIVDVALSLNRDSQELTKFFGCELGSQTIYDEPTDRAVVNGAHQDRDLQRHLSKYIENFVLCKQCRLPETNYKIKSGSISQVCQACGAKEQQDMTHKLTTFIVAHYKKKKELKEAAEKKDKKSGKEEKKEKKVAKADLPPPPPEAPAGGGAVETKPKSKKKETDSAEEQKNSKEKQQGTRCRCWGRWRRVSTCGVS